MNDLISKQVLIKSLCHLGTFLFVLLSAKSGQYLFFELHTSPAIIWPPTGIILAIFFLGGYQYAFSAFLGLFLAALTGPYGHVVPAVITTPLGQVLGALLGAYLLRKYKFNATFSTLKEVLQFLAVIFLACTIAPTITTIISSLAGNLTTTAYYSWSRSWAGYVFSSLIITPLLLTWVKVEKDRLNPGPIESTVAASLVIFSTYLLFWTHAESYLIFLFFTFFFIVHFWIGLRFCSRIVTLSVTISTIVGIGGLFLAPAPDKILSAQLLATELFLLLVVPIFYVFSALVKERTRTLVELQEALRKNERDSIVKNNFISLLAHELRNPLAPVKTILEILDHQQLDADTAKLIKEAHFQVHNMRRLLDDLLDMTRVTQGRFNLKVQRSHLNSMIGHAITVSKSVSNKAHTYILQSETNDKIWLNVDPVRFEQALVNILNNAAKYSDAGGNIVVSLKKENDLLIITIRDSGKGIAREYLEDIFQPFRQLEEKITDSLGGIGIGLSLIKYIIELHGGTIRALSEGIGKGSSFIITLPYAQYSSVEVPVKAPKTMTVQPLRILVVDDNHAAADALSKLLTIKGHTVKVAYEGSVVLQLSESFNPALVLLDIGLADMSGYEVANKLRAAGYNEKIVALSGYGQLEDKKAAQAAGCDYHFTKPVSTTSLEEYIINIQSPNKGTE